MILQLCFGRESHSERLVFAVLDCAAVSPLRDVLFAPFLVSLVNRLCKSLGEDSMNSVLMSFQSPPYE